jgi:arginyl-tRNA synthetase
MISIPKHLSSILTKAAIKAMPALTEKITVTPERNKDWDYTCPSAMKIYNMTKKNGSFGFATCQELAQAIVNNLDHEANDAISSIELKQAGGGDPAKSGFFMNIQLKDAFIEKYVNSINGADAISIA